MTTNMTRLVADIWFDDDELDGLARELERIVGRRNERVPRPDFFADYLERE